MNFFYINIFSEYHTDMQLKHIPHYPFFPGDKIVLLLIQVIFG